MTGVELRQRLETEKVVLADLARGLSISPQALNSKLNAKSLSVEFVNDVNRIVYSKGNEKAEVSIKHSVPYYDIDATAGNVTIFSEDGSEYVKDYISVPAFQDCEMFINVSGSSMYPKYVSGELIALKRLKDFEVIAYNEAYLIVTDEQRLLKYIRKSKKENMWTLHSEHSDYEDFDIHIKKVRFLYIVKGKITKNII